MLKKEGRKKERKDKKKAKTAGISSVAQLVKDLALSLLRLWSLLLYDLIPGLGPSTCHGHGQKKKKKEVISGAPVFFVPLRLSPSSVLCGSLWEARSQE